jgi:hypothetical protein
VNECLFCIFLLESTEIFNCLSLETHVIDMCNKDNVKVIVSVLRESIYPAWCSVGNIRDSIEWNEFFAQMIMYIYERRILFVNMRHEIDCHSIRLLSRELLKMKF